MNRLFQRENRRQHLTDAVNFFDCLSKVEALIQDLSPGYRFTSRSAHELRGPRPGVPGSDSNGFVVRLEGRRCVYANHVDGKKGGMFELVCDLGFSKAAAAQHLIDFSGLPGRPSQPRPATPATRTNSPLPPVVTNERLLEALAADQNRLVDGALPTSALRRGLSLTDYREAGCGVTEDGWLSIPMYGPQRELLDVQKRHPRLEVKNKYLPRLGKRAEGQGASPIACYGDPEAPGPSYLVEGPLNALTVYRATGAFTIGMAGASLSVPPLPELFRRDMVVYADRADTATKWVGQLVAYGVSNLLVLPPLERRVRVGREEKQADFCDQHEQLGRAGFRTFLHGEQQAARRRAGHTGLWGDVQARLDLDQLGKKYEVTAGGVKARLEREAAQDLTPRLLAPLRLGRAIEAGAAGHRALYMELGWIAPGGDVNRAWVLDREARAGTCFFSEALEGLPVTEASRRKVSAYLNDAGSHFRDKTEVGLATRLGWNGEVFALYEAQRLPFIGTLRQPEGSFDAWLGGLRAVLDLKEAGLIALVFLGFSAASPLVRQVARARDIRRPWIGLVAPTSTGKNSVIGLALSVWLREEEVRMSSGSTVKGAQDAAARLPDLPVFLDDLHTLSETPEGQQALRSLSLGFGGGQQRRTTTPGMQAQGGEERFGVAFYAAEHSMAEKITGGAQMRTIELEGQPLPPDNKEVADRLKRAARSHGQLGVLLAERYNMRPAELMEQLSIWEKIHQLKHKAVADDAVTLALLQVGLELVQDVCRCTLPVDQAVSYLARAATTRRSQADDASRVMGDLLRALQEADWVEGQRGDGKAQRVVYEGERPMAFDDETGYDVAPKAELVTRVFESYGGLINEKDILRKWRARGWIETRGQAFTVSRVTDTFRQEVRRITLKARQEADREA